MKKSAVMMLLCATVLYSQVPYTFQAGTTAKSAEVNANFTYLFNKIDSLGKKIDTLRRGNDSLSIRIGVLSSSSNSQAALIDTLSDRNDSLEKRIAGDELPIGTILGTLAQMDSTNGKWVLADGRTATTEYFQAMGQANIPDLRGMFLRGLNAGRSDGKQDPEGVGRTAGSYQADTLKSHSHRDNISAASGYIYGGGSWGVSNLQTGEFGGLETRGRNSAVYWYVKVK